MNKHIIALASRILTPGEYSAMHNLLNEFRVSRNHRRGLREVRRGSLSRPAKLNLGSGKERKEGFLNVDMFPGGDLTLDLRRTLPFDSNCCELIFSEHFIEHIDYPEPVSSLLRECFRVLKPGGVLRFSVPDTEWPLTDYAKGPDAGYFRSCMDNSVHPAWCITRIEHINFHFHQDGEHRFAYDEETARKILKSVGFQNVQRVSVDHSMDSKHRAIGSLFMSAQKPA